jgi:ABC-type phosphate transport system substrate-binding protein
MKRRAASLVGLAAMLAMIVCVAIGTPAASAAAEPCATIHGEGSSLQGLAQKEIWTKKHEAGTECSNAFEATYTATSSGKGMEQWGSVAGKLLEFSTTPPMPAFIGTDVGPSLAQQANMDKAGEKSASEENMVMTVPVAQSAIAVIVSLPKACVEPSTTNVKAAELRKAWETDTTEFKKIVEGATGCTALPKLQARSAASGTTAGYKRYLGAIDGTELLTKAEVEPWLKLNETPAASENTTWPSTLPMGQPELTGSSGGELAHDVIEKPGSIGYADISDAIAQGFTTSWVKHKNAGGEEYFVAAVLMEALELEFISPESATNEAANCANAKYKGETSIKVAPLEDLSNARQTNVDETGVYPVCTLTFDLAWEHYEYPSGTDAYPSAAETATAVDSYLEWIVGKGEKQGQGSGGAGEALELGHFAKLPSGIQAEAAAGVNLTHIKG